MRKNIDAENPLFFQERQFLEENKGIFSFTTPETITKFNLDSKPLPPSTVFSQKESRIQILYKSALQLRRTEGTRALLIRVYKFLKGERRCLLSSVEAHKQWIKSNEPGKHALKIQRKNELSFKYRPLLSVLMFAGNVEAENLHKTISSVIAQTYSNWELCIIADYFANSNIGIALGKYANLDKRIKVKFLESACPAHADFNEALKMAGGEYLAVLNQNDQLAANALFENIRLLNQHTDADMIYSDEDKIDTENIRFKPHFKPDWSPDFFYSSMYTGHLAVYRKASVEKAGGFQSGFISDQDYDLVLRLIEQTSKIYHIPKILYHRRLKPNANSIKEKTKALYQHFQRLNIKVEITPGMTDSLLRVKRKLETHPKVSIIIPSKNQQKILQSCIESIRNKSTYPNYEIIIVDNNSSQSEALEYLEKLSNEPEMHVVKYPHPFNFAAINNLAAKHATGEFLVFLNNDTKVISPDWLESMVEHATRSEVAAVGARLLYEDGRIQHAGVIIGIGGMAGHSHKFYSSDHPGYFSRAKAVQNVSAVTAACMMVRKDLFESLGGFDEKNLAVAFNDIDFCLRARQMNLLVVYTPYAELYHLESISRGCDRKPENASRFKGEVDYMLNKWKENLQYDPYYNPNLTLQSEDFSISMGGRSSNL